MDKGKSCTQSAPEVWNTCHRELRHCEDRPSYSDGLEPLGAVEGKDQDAQDGQGDPGRRAGLPRSKAMDA